MRAFKTVFMRGGTSKGCMFRKEDLPDDRLEWDSIFLQVMGDPDPKQIDGMGGTVSSNNKIVVVWKSEENDVDVEYLVGQVIVGKGLVDYKSNCGNMTAAVGPFAVEEGMVDIIKPITTVRMLNR
ncbi:PrpF domain-containing protein, partial [Clostridium perfringens]|nr:PrpF domain-containing protein [Clostridium perfringens]